MEKIYIPTEGTALEVLRALTCQAVQECDDESLLHLIWGLIAYEMGGQTQHETLHN